MGAGAGGAAFDVVPYEDKVFEEFLCNPHVEIERIQQKFQVEFLKGYLAEIKAKTIVIEDDYVDRDYLEDFAAYYVRCFVEYKRRCKRLHFFSESFSSLDLSQFIGGGAGALSHEKLAGTYLGFVVVKPLPETVIGRTCLSTYPDDGKRNYLIVRSYDANLFGIPLEVKRTLAFQEQDQVVAACASAALWSAFHGTCREFGHRLPSPAEITAAAGAKASDVDRNLPSKGLTWSMMADAIRHVGLEPVYAKPAGDNDLKAQVYAYIRGRIPPILGFNRYDPLDGDEAWKSQLHAVAVSGFRLDRKKTTPTADDQGFRLFAYRMDRLYVHDDQIGPFARMFIDGVKPTVKDGDHEEEKHSLRTIYRNRDDKEDKVRALEPVVLLPLYHKIRIPYSLIHGTVFEFNAGFETLLESVNKKREFEWDIYLTTNNEFKEDLASNTNVESERKLRYLTHPLPRFMWRATALDKGIPTLDLLFDATDIEQGTLFAMVVEYDPDFVGFMPVVFAQEGNKSLFNESSARRIVDWYIAWGKKVAP